MSWGMGDGRRLRLEVCVRPLPFPHRNESVPRAMPKAGLQGAAPLGRIRSEPRRLTPGGHDPGDPLRSGTMIIDMHTHAGRPRRTGEVDRSVLATMRKAGVAAAVVSAIADIPVIRRDPDTKRLVKIRDPEPGECLAATHGYLDSF